LKSVSPGPLSQALITDEAREVTHMARRIAAIARGMRARSWIVNP